MKLGRFFRRYLCVDVLLEGILILGQVPVLLLLLVVVVHLLHQVEPVQELLLRPDELRSIFQVLHFHANLEENTSLLAMTVKNHLMVLK